MTIPGNPPSCDWCGSRDVETVEGGPYWLHRCKAPRCAHEWIGGVREGAWPHLTDADTGRLYAEWLRMVTTPGAESRVVPLDCLPGYGMWFERKEGGA